MNTDQNQIYYIFNNSKDNINTPIENAFMIFLDEHTKIFDLSIDKKLGND